MSALPNGILKHWQAGRPFHDLMQTPGKLVQAYEDKHHPAPEYNGSKRLWFLMEVHNFSQSDLPEIGTSSEVVEILSGRRKLNLRQVRLPANRFSVSPAVFV